MAGSDWGTTTLGAVARVEMGQSPPSSFVSDSEGAGVPFLQGNAEFSSLHPMPRLWCRKPAKMSKAGDVLISVRAPVGAINRADRDYCIGRGLAAVRFTESDPDFGYHALRLYSAALRRVAQGTTFEAVSGADLRTLSFPRCSAEEQRRIAAVLDTLDEAIRWTEQVIAKLQQTKQGLLHDLLTWGVDENGELRPSHAEAPHLYKDSALGWFPRAWGWSDGATVCREIVVGIVVRPTQYYRDEGVPVLRSANIREDHLDPSDLVYMSRRDHAIMSKSAVAPGDVVTVRTGYPGTTCVVPDALPEANCVDIIISRPGRLITAAFLSTWVNSSFGKGLVLRVQGGLAQQHFNIGEMKRLVVMVPPLAEQHRINEIMATARARLDEEQVTLSKLYTLKHGLSHDLLTGRVRVPNRSENE
jgi:type I restriction enzyme, S subunit